MMSLPGVWRAARTPQRILCMLLLLHALAQRAAAQPAPLERAHAHNDFEHARPLFDALERGFSSIEADVHLVDGRLLVAHSRDSVDAGRLLEALYLAPLRAWVQQHGGRAHAGTQPARTISTGCGRFSLHGAGKASRSVCHVHKAEKH